MHINATQILCWWWQNRATAQSCPAHPKDSQWSKGLASVVAKPCVKMLPHAPWTTLSQSEPDESRHCHLGTCPCHQGRKKTHWWNNLRPHGQKTCEGLHTESWHNLKLRKVPQHKKKKSDVWKIHVHESNQRGIECTCWSTSLLHRHALK